MSFQYLTEEVSTVSIPKIVGVLSCGALLCLGLSNVSQAGNATYGMVFALGGAGYPGQFHTDRYTYAQSSFAAADSLSFSSSVMSRRWVSIRT